METIGDHIRLWRISNDFLQKDIAQMLFVSEDTITGWEQNRAVPGTKQIAKLVKLLGYLPIKIDTSTLGGRITQFRYLNGLTPKEFGALVNADPSTVRAWEIGTNKPSKNRRLLIEMLIKC